MAGGTVIDDASMIEHGANKRTGIVAHAAIVASGNVRTRLADGRGAIVAGSTIVTDARVVEYRRQKRRGGVAKVTTLVSG